MQLAASGTSPANIAIPTMGGIHALIGIREGLITVGALTFIYAARRDLITAAETHTGNAIGLWAAGLLIAVALAVLSPLASSHPDGLEWVARQRGFLNLAQNPRFNIIPDYILPGVSNQTLATVLAGIIGALLVFAVAWGVAYSRRSR